MRILLSWRCWGACQEGVCLDPSCVTSEPHHGLVWSYRSGHSFRVTGPSSGQGRPQELLRAFIRAALEDMGIVCHHRLRTIAQASRTPPHISRMRVEILGRPNIPYHMRGDTDPAKPPGVSGDGIADLFAYRQGRARGFQEDMMLRCPNRQLRTPHRQPVLEDRYQV